ncbi:MAG: YeeE/YedE family protein [Granulosicoccus sp.]|nr:YeeE/YedE family protein [Granulosicoccus sp.]
MLPSVITQFTPWASLIGGVMIGLSALLVYYLFGRVAGISGITTGGLLAPASDWLWRVAFILGLVCAPVLMQVLNNDWPGVNTLAESSVSNNYVGMALAGLAVGFGTVLGSGCTSGHGVCGLGRKSARSLIAVFTFMLTAGLTVAVLRHVI